MKNGAIALEQIVIMKNSTFPVLRVKGVRVPRFTPFKIGNFMCIKLLSFTSAIFFFSAIQSGWSQNITLDDLIGLYSKNIDDIDLFSLQKGLTYNSVKKVKLIDTEFTRYLWDYDRAPNNKEYAVSHFKYYQSDDKSLNSLELSTSNETLYIKARERAKVLGFILDETYHNDSGNLVSIYTRGSVKILFMTVLQGEQVSYGISVSSK